MSETGDIYSQEAVQKAIDALTNAAGTQGLCLRRSPSPLQAQSRRPTPSISGFEIVQGPRVYIEKINISGNTRTHDDIIRRQFRLQEGDAFNRVLIDRSRTRIRVTGLLQGSRRQERAGQPARPHQSDGGCHRTVHRLAVGGPGLFLNHLAAGRSQLYRQQLVRPRPESARLPSGLLHHQAGGVLLHRALFPGPRRWRRASICTRPRPTSTRRRSRATRPPRCCAWAIRSPNTARWR